MRGLKIPYKLGTDTITAKDTTRDFTMLAATWAFAYGVTLIVQDRGIWAYPAYETARLLPGSPPSWGVILVVGGTLMFLGMFTGKHRLMKAGCWVCLLWHFFFVISLGRAVVQDDLSASPVVNYAVAFVAYSLLLVTYRGKNAIRNTPQTGEQPTGLDGSPGNDGLQPLSGHD